MSRSRQPWRSSTIVAYNVADILKNPKFPAEWPFSPMDFKRQDETTDNMFYYQPRLVYHIDDAAVSALTKFYAQSIPENADLLDICSSWVSHLPDSFKGGRVAGLGMNGDELKANKRLTEFTVKDLNKDPVLPFDDASFDVVTNVVSVDYLNKPLEVFKEINRVLRPGGKAIMSFSNRCFPSKAINIWLSTNDYEHIFIVGCYFNYAGGFEKLESVDLSPNPGMSDPMYVVQAYKKSA
ncbi:hypothetical protein NDN08_000738 [Rhodosorus marinus]|uniref:Methyltransferase type 11 domain-containing protein n=1 Tax=Rhodosorus marinus TaxID=101924 RepID=A0AAV8URM3_9RHOD|nr:hypothetical protein NDN08_000738 [Rhodosorus marinus]